MLEVSGKPQFSAFGGWQLANNALYMYEHVDSSERKRLPARFAQLDRAVRDHMDTISKVKLTKEDSASNIFYLWSERGPLIQYMIKTYKNDTITPPFKKWASLGPLYQDYAAELIRKYPLQYVKEFVWPNALKYAMPPPEFLEQYNMGQDSVGRLAKEWFHYSTQKVISQKKKPLKIAQGAYYSLFATLANALLFICLAGLAIFAEFKNKANGLAKTILIIVCFWILNLGFSIAASPIVLRYEIFPALISFSLAIVIAEAIYLAGIEQDKQLKMQVA